MDPAIFHPFRWLGKLSYSLYLWHWPILIIAAQYAGHSLSVADNLLWVLLALAFSIVSYFARRESAQALEVPVTLHEYGASVWEPSSSARHWA